MCQQSPGRVEQGAGVSGMRRGSTELGIQLFETAVACFLFYIYGSADEDLKSYLRAILNDLIPMRNPR